MNKLKSKFPRYGTEYQGDPSAYQQLSYHRSKNGRPAGKRRRLDDIVRSNIARCDYWFKGIKSFDDHGFYLNDKYKPVGGEALFPVWFLGLQSVVQNGVDTYPFLRLHLKNEVGGVTPIPPLFCARPVSGLDAVGALSDVLHHSENSAHNNVYYAGPSAFCKWTDVKLNLWGAKAKSVRWRIQIVRSSGGRCNPWAYNNLTGENFDEEFQEELREMVRPIVVNPISTANNMRKSDLVVLREFVYDLDPVVGNADGSGEGDPDPHCKQVTIFNRWDRNVRLDWTTKNLYDLNVVDDSIAKFTDPTRNGDERVYNVLNTHPEADKEVFMIISCTNYTPFAEEGFTNATDSSFDLSFRSSWSRFA